MYLSLLRLNPLTATVQQDLRDVTSLHKTIMRAFPQLADPEPVRASFGVLHRLEMDRDTGTVRLYVQSKQKPDWGKLPKGYLVVSEGETGEAVKSLEGLKGALHDGRILKFRLRANPTRKIETKSAPDGTRRNGRRVPLRNEEAVIDWLVRQSHRHGFSLVEVSIASIGSAERFRSYTMGRTFQGVLFEGRLRVEDPTVFYRAVVQGIGPGKAFGFGLLSVASE